jgi:hypothetical protein
LWTEAICTADRTTTGQSLVDITDLSIALLASSTYYFEGELAVASSATTGNQYGVQFSVAGATLGGAWSGSQSATVTRAGAMPAQGAKTNSIVLVAGGGQVWFKGSIVTPGTGGNLTLQHLKVTSGTSTVYKGSTLRARKA